MKIQRPRILRAPAGRGTKQPMKRPNKTTSAVRMSSPRLIYDFTRQDFVEQMSVISEFRMKGRA